MKVIIYSAPTVNGMIAPKDEDDYRFITDKAWGLYLKKLKKAGVFVMGRRTYESSLRTGAFPYDCFNVVMTKNKIKNKWGNIVIFSPLTPKALFKYLEKQGYEKIIVTGGHLSTSFLKEKLVDEIWIHLMPTIITNGINLFEGKDFKINLKLINLKKSPIGEVFLKYKVKY